MIHEGYAAVTSRRVAASAGLKPQLVHYYFRTMDDLFLALVRRRTDRGLEHLARSLESEQPLWSLWELSRDRRGAALTMELVALANHRKTIRSEIASSAERFRSIQLHTVASALERAGLDAGSCPPMVCTVLVTAISQILVIEEEVLGMATGHAETIACVEELLTALEGSRRRTG